MDRNLTTIIMVVVVGFASVFVVGCANDAQTGAVVGGLAGAGIGQLAGGHTEATLIGAAIGAGTGYIVGNEGERKKTEAQINAVRADQQSVIVWITNSNGSKVPVRLTKSGPNFVGPRGELYAQLPSQEQLRPVYGF